MSRAGGAALFVVMTTMAVLALAEEKPTARLSWVRLPGAETCVDDDGMRKSVVARLGRDPFVASPTIAVEGTIAREPKRWIAKLWVRDAAGVSLGNRELTSEADTCASLGEAVALAIALAIDPDAPPVAPSVAPSGKPGASATGSVSPNPSSLNSANSANSAGSAKKTPRSTPAASALNSANSVNPSLGNGAPPAAAVFARFVLSTSLLPKPTPGVALAFDPAFSHHWRAVLGAMYLPPQKTSDGVASISLTAANAGLCGGTTGTMRVGVDLCFGLHAGATHTAVHRFIPEDPGDRFWLGASAGLRLRVAIVSGLFADGLVDMMVPLTRHRFFVTPSSPDTPIFSQGPFGLVAGAGLGWNLF